MHELILTTENSKSGHRQKLLAEAKARESRSKVYRTYSGCADGPHVTFVTTSKDIHLALGTFSRDGLRALSEVLDDECNPNGVGDPSIGEMMFGFENDKSQLLVTCSRGSDNGLIMHLSASR